MSTASDRFWSKVNKTDGCWLWTGATVNWGYGQFRVGRGHTLAHRLSYEMATGQSIPAGMMVCHRCDTPACVNPSHLFLGSSVDNMQDMLAKGRNHWAARDRCSMGHEYSAESTYRHGKRRHCKKCQVLREIIRKFTRHTTGVAA